MASVNELDVVGVRVEMPSNQPIVLLKESGGERYLPIWIGAVEATAIAFAQQGVVPPRPMTHDLIRDLLAATGEELTQVRITSLQDGIFYAELVFASGVEVSARPSDAIAVALRTGSPIFGAEEVLEEAGIAIPRRAGGRGREFREFLDQMSPEDFGRPAGLTAADHRPPSLDLRSRLDTPGRRSRVPIVDRPLSGPYRRDERPRCNSRRCDPCPGQWVAHAGLPPRARDGGRREAPATVRPSRHRRGDG